MPLGKERQMTFEEIDAGQKTFLSSKDLLRNGRYIDEGDRSYWRKRAVEEAKAASSNKSN
jgi:hypothetical protein